MKELVKNEEWLNEKEIELVKKQFFPDSATSQEIEYCMGVAKAFNLNPILKQIYFVPRGSWFKQQGQKDKWVEKVEPLAGRDSFLTLAHRSGAFESIESTTEIRKIPFLDGTKWTEKDELVGICKVWKKGYKKPFKVEVNYTEYVQKKKDGSATAFWKDKPHTMIKKVAESQCLRKAFDITGLYDETETSSNYQNVNISTDETIETVPTNDTPKQNVRNVLKPSNVENIVKDVTVEDINFLYGSVESSIQIKMHDVFNNNAGWKTDYTPQQLNQLKIELEQIQ